MVKQWVASSLVRIRVMRRGDAGEMVWQEVRSLVGLGVKRREVRSSVRSRVKR